MLRSLIKNSHIAGLLVSISAAALFIQGCNRDKEQPTLAPVQVVKAAPGTAKQLVKPVQKQASSTLKMSAAPVNMFDFSTKKDPFKPFAILKPTPASKPQDAMNDAKSALPIHSFDVSQFKLIGIVTGGKENHAMVTDPNGKGYVLKVGMTIGKNDGRVMAVTNGGVDILEQFRDDNGRVRKEHIKITLPRKQ